MSIRDVHVHRPQRVGRDTVRYSGSPLKYSFSEARYGKSVALVELREKKSGDEVGECVSFELIPLVPLHDVREIRGTLADVLAMGAESDYLHITLSDEHPQLDAMAKIHEVFPNAMMLDYNNVTVLIDRPQTQLTADPDSMDTLDLFSAFYESQVGNSLDDELIAKVEDSAAKGPDGQEEGAQ